MKFFKALLLFLTTCSLFNVNNSHAKIIKAETPSLAVVTPLRYFGQRETIIADLFNLLPKRSFKTFFDPFSGSGSISFAAMQKRIAQQYVINESYPVLINLWKAIKADKNFVYAVYEQKYKQLYNAPAGQRERIFKLILDEFNKDQENKKAAAYYLFLNNNALYNIPYFTADKKLTFDFDPQSADTIDLTKKRIFALHTLLNSQMITFKNGDFFECLKHATADDIVIFDPPYPEQEKILYFNLTEPSKLHLNLIHAIRTLNEKKVPFLLLYGAGEMSEAYQFNDPSLHVIHLARLSHNPVCGGAFIEHMYVSHSCNLDIGKLPSHIITYISYEDAEQKLLN